MAPGDTWGRFRGHLGKIPGTLGEDSRDTRGTSQLRIEIGAGGARPAENGLPTILMVPALPAVFPHVIDCQTRRTQIRRQLCQPVLELAPTIGPSSRLLLRRRVRCLPVLTCAVSLPFLTDLTFPAPCAQKKQQRNKQNSRARTSNSKNVQNRIVKSRTASGTCERDSNHL